MSEVATESKASQERIQYTQWLKRGNNQFWPADNAKTVTEVDAGVYNIRNSPNNGMYLVKRDICLDELIEMPSKESQALLEGIETFWKRKDKFKQYGYAFKRGILLYGIPGGGKTSIINMLCDKLIKERNGIVFIVTNESDLNLYSAFINDVYRPIEQDRPIITILEDIDGLCQYKELETKLLNVLDGIEQVENIVYIATTNYTEKLSERITSRPNRFDIRIEVKSPNAECRELYLKHKLKPEDLESIDLAKWVAQTEGFTMAHLQEVIKSVIILGNTFESTIDRLNNMGKITASRNYNEEFAKKIGFNKS